MSATNTFTVTKCFQTAKVPFTSSRLDLNVKQQQRMCDTEKREVAKAKNCAIREKIANAFSEPEKRHLVRNLLVAAAMHHAKLNSNKLSIAVGGAIEAKKQAKAKNSKSGTPAPVVHGPGLSVEYQKILLEDIDTIYNDYGYTVAKNSLMAMPLWR